MDCVKTTVQAEMGKDTGDDVDEGGWQGTIKGILKKGGVAELTRGIDVSTVRAVKRSACC